MTKKEKEWFDFMDRAKKNGVSPFTQEVRDREAFTKKNAINKSRKRLRVKTAAILEKKRKMTVRKKAKSSPFISIEEAREILIRLSKVF